MHQIHRDEAYLDKHGFNLKYIRATQSNVYLVNKNTGQISEFSFSYVFSNEFKLGKLQQHDIDSINQTQAHTDPCSSTTAIQLETSDHTDDEADDSSLSV